MDLSKETWNSEQNDNHMKALLMTSISGGYERLVVDGNNFTWHRSNQENPNGTFSTGEPAPSSLSFSPVSASISMLFTLYTFLYLHSQIKRSLQSLYACKSSREASSNKTHLLFKSLFLDRLHTNSVISR